MNNLTDAEINKLADAGEELLKQDGLERLLNDILNTPPPKFHEGLKDDGWQNYNEWTNPPTE